MRLAKVITSLGLSTGITDSLSNLITSLSFSFPSVFPFISIQMPRSQLTSTYIPSSLFTLIHHTNMKYTRKLGCFFFHLIFAFSLITSFITPHILRLTFYSQGSYMTIKHIRCCLFIEIKFD